jgi:hypothetical protein
MIGPGEIWGEIWGFFCYQHLIINKYVEKSLHI